MLDLNIVTTWGDSLPCSIVQVCLFVARIIEHNDVSPMRVK